MSSTKYRHSSLAFFPHTFTNTIHIQSQPLPIVNKKQHSSPDLATITFQLVQARIRQVCSRNSSLFEKNGCHSCTFSDRVSSRYHQLKKNWETCIFPSQASEPSLPPCQESWRWNGTARTAKMKKAFKTFFKKRIYSKRDLSLWRRGSFCELFSETDLNIEPALTQIRAFDTSFSLGEACPVYRFFLKYEMDSVNEVSVLALIWLAAGFTAAEDSMMQYIADTYQISHAKSTYDELTHGHGLEGENIKAHISAQRRADSSRVS